MIRMTARDLLAATGATLVAGDAEVVFEGVVIDSRQAGNGAAFVAFVGENVDGNRFAAQAFEGGAAVVVLTAEPEPAAIAAAQQAGGALVRAAEDDGEQFMLALAGAWRARNPQWTVVGVTGSVGKTTTKEMLAAGLGALAPTHATKGNFNNLLGVPLTLFATPEDAQILVVEMGMNNAGELARIAAAARPCVAAITNVGTSHIGHLGSREGIARAKAEVVGGLAAAHDVEPTLVLTATDDYADFIEDEFCKPAGVRVLRVGAQGAAAWTEGVRLDGDGLASLELVFHDGERLAGTLSLPGRAMAYDLATAMGVVEALGLDRRVAFDAICALASSHMRLEVRQEGDSPRVVDDSYNASPASMASSLDVLESLACEGRRVAVLGEMGELGDEAEHLHALVGAYAAAKPLDLLVFVGGPLADVMATAARTMGFSEDKTERFATALDAARVLGPVFTRDDVVLAKASRAVELDRFVKEVLGA